MSITIFHILLLGALTLGGCFVAWLVRHQRRQSYIDDMDALFNQTWSGREGEELYVWQLIKSEYLGSRNRDEYIWYIHKKISKVDKSRMLSNYSIDEFGNIEDSEKDKKIQLN